MRTAVRWEVREGDCLDVLPTLPAGSVHCCVTSPPYWGLRDYGCEGQLGMEPTPEAFVANLVVRMREVRRVLRDDGTLWLNLGDSYAGSWGAQGRQGKTGDQAGRSAPAQRQIAAAQKKASGTGSLSRTPGLKGKDLVGIPWMAAFALRADGWFLRSDVIWAKGIDGIPDRRPKVHAAAVKAALEAGISRESAERIAAAAAAEAAPYVGAAMPESVRDRCVKSHEYVFLLTKNAKYDFDFRAVQSVAACAGKPRGGSSNRYQSDPAGMDRKLYDRRNRRSVWAVPPDRERQAKGKVKHFATFPQELVRPCIRAGCPKGGTVLDVFSGRATTGVVALAEGRSFLGVEINPEYAAMARERIAASVPPRLLWEEDS